jgi:hypothetical protein
LRRGKHRCIRARPAQIDSFASWVHLGNVPALIKLVPAAGSTALLLATLKFGRNPIALPAVLVSIPVVFHLVLLATGTSLQQAADAGWVMQPEVRPLALFCRPCMRVSRFAARPAGMSATSLAPC